MDDSAIERMVKRAQETRRLTNIALAAARRVCEDALPGRMDTLVKAMAELDAHTGQNGPSRAAD